MNRLYRLARAGICSALFAVLFWQSASAEQLNIRHYDTRDGIPQVQVTDVRQDAEGYLWVGTYGGLARYNGQRFLAYGNGHGLTSNYITRLHADPSGRLYVGTSGGLCWKLPQGFECVDDEIIENAEVNAMAFHQASMWIGADSGLFRIDADAAHRIELPEAGRGSEVLSLESDGGQILWIGTAQGLFAIHDNEFVRVVGADLIMNRRIMSLKLDGETLWIGTGSGLYRLDNGEVAREPQAEAFDETPVVDLHIDARGRLWAAGLNGLLRRTASGFEHLTVYDGLRTNQLHRVYSDREGVVWIAHDEGLSKILPASFIGYTERSGLLASFIRAINEDDKQRAWLGTRTGIQVVPYRDGYWQTGDSLLVRTNEGLPDNRVFAIDFSADGTVLIATAEGVVRWDDDVGVVEIFDERHGLPSNEVHGLLEDRRGRVWISTTRGTVYLEDGRIHEPGQSVLRDAFALRIVEDEAGALWFTSLRHGLLILGTDGELIRYRSEHGLTDEMLWDAAPAHDGSMWVGSNGDGLFRVWPDGRIERYTTDDGLADDSVWQVLEDDQRRLWAYTNNGLSRLDGEYFENFDERDGLLHLEGGATGAFQFSNGQLWFASADGFMRYAPEYSFEIDVPPPVVIELVSLAGSPIEQDDVLEHPARTLEFEFAALSYFDENAVRYQYRLIGADREWSQPVIDPRVTYANLGWGQYRFEVIAISPEGIESLEPATFTFNVMSPVWARWWFVALVLAALLLLVWGWMRWRVGKIEARRARLQELVDERTRELKNANRRLSELARTDQLTGLPNRRFLIDQINRDIEESRRARETPGEYRNEDIVFIMLDIDHFKEVNDRFGHDAGDRILCEQASIIKNQLRETDYVVRWGGEEFLVVARDAEASKGTGIAERIVSATREHQFSIDDQGRTIGLTCSAGIASYPFLDESPSLDWEQVVQLADLAVYEAKASGRDSWVQLMVDSDAEIESGEQLMDLARQDLSALVEAGLIRRKVSG